MTDNTYTENKDITTAFDGEAEKSLPADDIRENTPEKTYTQSQVEALITDRLRRERKNAENLRSVKDLLKQLSESGSIKSSSYTDMANELKERLAQKDDGDSGDKKSDIAGAEDVAVLSGGEEKAEHESVPEDFSALPEREALPEKKDLSEDKVGEGDKAYTLSANDARAIRRAFPECDIGELLCDEAFEKFACGRSGAIEDVYRDYLTFVTVLNSKNENLERRMFAENASTAFSASDKAYSSDGSEGLTKRQMEIARESGMTYREYASLLSDIPRKTKL